MKMSGADLDLLRHFPLSFNPDISPPALTGLKDYRLNHLLTPNGSGRATLDGTTVPYCLCTNGGAFLVEMPASEPDCWANTGAVPAAVNAAKASAIGRYLLAIKCLFMSHLLSWLLPIYLPIGSGQFKDL